MVNDEQTALSRAFAALSPFSSSRRIPFEKKPWVQEAKTWETTWKRKPGHITLYMRFGSKTCSFLCSPEIRFESMKEPQVVHLARHVAFVSDRLPDEGTVKEYEMEEGDIIDIYYDRPTAGRAHRLPPTSLSRLLLYCTSRKALSLSRPPQG
ncbi:hypothetical protein A1Q2_06577 [Trichosporon asahii var. asahii CBS 8904]|uniref:Uncharacterized protein n=1 Tax=Trichosporon asahii var. asahii (strain CBS 8904) TaxID=1220162 RepID=K1WC28_TRIAC|nr:hypothetical protein A1Q2_06577 [Trichosporon asahii var. asahii CBS 8904]